MSATALELADIQGNVLQGYGLPYAAYVSLQLPRNAAEGRGLLAELEGSITNAQRWKGKPRVTFNLAISHTGLERLGVSPEALATFPPEFVAGMADRAQELGDVGKSSPANWQPGLRQHEIHLLAVIHAASKTGCKERVEELARVAGEHGVTARDPQFAALGKHGEREHFGFADGVGQPAVDGQTGPDYPGQGVPTEGRTWRSRRAGRGWRLIAPGEFILGYADEDGVLPDAPAHPYARNGTFMVFRKLEQDVVGFRDLLHAIAELHFDGDEELTAAKIAGRWRDGTPLMLSPDAANPDLARDRWRTNDFRYADDPRGHLCPLGAHTRRANPRDGLFGGGERTRRHRIIRRGMPYEDTGEDAGKGLMFVCFNANIFRQFETVNSWLVGGEAFGLDHGDLLAGGRDAPAMTIQGDPPVMFRAGPERGPLVTTRGGEYLFLPGLAALAALAGADGAQ